MSLNYTTNDWITLPVGKSKSLIINTTLLKNTQRATKETYHFLPFPHTHTWRIVSWPHIVLLVHSVRGDMASQGGPGGVSTWVNCYNNMVNSLRNSIFSLKVNPSWEVHQAFLGGETRRHIIVWFYVQWKCFLFIPQTWESDYLKLRHFEGHVNFSSYILKYIIYKSFQCHNLQMFFITDYIQLAQNHFSEIWLFVCNKNLHDIHIIEGFYTENKTF